MVCELAQAAGGRVTVENMREDAIHLINILTLSKAYEMINTWDFSLISLGGRS